MNKKKYQDLLDEVDALKNELSALKEIENPLVESEALFRILIEASPDAVYLLDSAGKVIRANAAAAGMLGRSQSEILELSIGDIDPNFPSQDFKVFWESLPVGSSRMLESTHVRKDGKEFPVEIHASKFSVGQEIHFFGIARDISHRKKKQGQRLKLLEHLNSSQKIAKVGSWDWDLVSNQTEWSDEMFRLYGLDQKDGSLPPSRFLENVHPDDREILQAAIDESMTSGRFRCTYRLFRYDNRQEIIISARGEVLFDDQGSPFRHIGTARNITKYIEAEEELRTSEEKYRILYENAPLCFQSLDEDGTILIVNQAWLDTLGYSRDEVIGKKFNDFVHPNYKLRQKQKFEKFIKQGLIHNAHLKLCRRDGQIFDALFEGRVGYDPEGNFLQTFCAFADVSEQIKAQKLAERAQKIISTTTDAAIATDLSANITLWNKGAENLFGYKEKEVIGKPISKLYREESSSELEAIGEGLLAGEEFSSVEAEVFDKEGNKKTVLVSLTSLLDDEGKVSEFVTFSKDITAEKRNAEALKESERQLSILMNNLPGMAYRCKNDELWTMIFVSEGCKDLLGYQPSDLIDNHQVSYNSLIHSDDRQRVGEEVHAALEDKTKYQITYRVISREGVEKWVWEAGRKVLESSGEEEILEGIILDVTARMKAQEALADSEERFREVFDHISAGIAIYRSENGEEFYFNDINPSGALSGGLSREEHLGKEVREVYPGVEELGLFEILQQVWREGGSIHHPVAQYKDERISLWVENFITKLPSDEVMAVYEDITARKQVEDQLRYQAQLISSVTEAVISMDIDFQIVTWNDAAEDLYGWAEEEVLGRAFNEIVQPNYLNKSREEVLEEYAKNDQWEGIAIHRRKSGEEVYIQTSVSAIYNLDGQAVGSVAVNLDVSELKNREKALEESTEKLKVLHQLDTAILESRSLQDITKFSVDSLQAVLECLGVQISLLDFERKSFKLQANTGTPIVMKPALEKKAFEEYSQYIPLQSMNQTIILDKVDLPETIARIVSESGMKRFYFVPLAVNMQLFGVISIGFDRLLELDTTAEVFMNQVANQLAIAIRQINLYKQLEMNSERMSSLARKVITAQEDERRVIARELHDEAGQALTALKIDLELLSLDLSEESGDIAKQLESAIELTGKVHEDLRGLAQGLRPTSLDTIGLLPSIDSMFEDFQRRTLIRVNFDKPGILNLNDIQQIVIYRVLQEALTNISRHANATEVNIKMKIDGDQLHLNIEDNGEGFDAEKLLSSSSDIDGFGLSSMQERFQVAGGNLIIESTPGRGTRILGSIPLDQPTE